MTDGRLAMTKPAATPAAIAPRRRYRFSLRWLLAVITLAALACGWISWQHQRGREQVVLVGELADLGFSVALEEPTGVGLLVRKFVPQREAWLREQMGAGWFGRPTVFVCFKLSDAQVPDAAARLARLGTAREIHLASPQLTEQGADALRGELPRIAVVPADRPELHQYLRSRTEQPQFAYAAVGMAALLAVGVAATVAVFAWPLVRRQASQVPTHSCRAC